MSALELKIPPPLVALLTILAMWGLAQFPPYWELSSPYHIILSILIAILGVACAVAGFAVFRRAKTTINPTRPGKATTLVTTGIYRITRNPMYVGLLCILIAWACYLQSAWALLGSVVFVLWIHYFQILPEERILTRLFGQDYTNYLCRVRRWL